MNARTLQDEMRKSLSWLQSSWSLTPICATDRSFELPVDPASSRPALRVSALSPWLPGRENAMRRAIALVSIAAIVLGTALATLPGRWSGAEPAGSETAELYTGESGVVDAPLLHDGNPPAASGEAAGR